MKKLNFTFLFTMLMSMVGLNASAKDHDIEVQNADGKTIYYNFINNNTELAVTYKGILPYFYPNEYTGNVVIPESVTYNEKTYSVTSIEWGAFKDCSGLTSITIPNSVTSIGGEAFRGCSGLTSVTIPNSVTSIGGSAFSICSGLTSVTIPNSVTRIGEEAFSGCSKLTLVECNIGKAFNISSNTFSSDTYNNAELRVPRDLSSMYKQAEGWKNFKSITEGDLRICGPNLTYTYSEASGKLTIQGTGAMYDFSSSSPAPWNSYKGDIITIVIEDGATSVGSYAFSGCNSLYSVTFGKDVKTVGISAFENCSALKKVIAPDIAAWCGINFGNETANPLFYVHHLYSDKSTEITELVIPDGVTSIGSFAFFGCSGLTSITIPNSVTSIGNYAFYNWLGLTSITIPNSVTSIGNGVFRGCSGLTSVTIPNSVTSIGGYAFDGCSGLTSVTIGTGVTSIETTAFSGCSKLASVTFHCNNVGTWFSGLSSLKEVWIEKEVTSIAQQSFAGCSGLRSVYNNAEDAFTIAKNTFNDATYSSAKLYVPTGMKATYEETPWWLSFNKMEEYDFPTGINALQQSKDVKVVDAYQINGLKTGSMQKGLNILKMSDGTTIKVVK